MAESYEKQKRFITDAGHELKTPLTIISADTDLAEVECGENQWLTDIRRQAQRLTGLTHDLIFLSRMEEQPQLQLLDFPLSDLVEETAQSFLAPAKSQGKTLSLSIQPLLSCTGDEKSLRQLLSILLDNALRYAPAGADIAVELQSKGRSILLRVSNPMAHPLDKAALEHLFDRFYRGDAARSAGGYGLGLSIARSIVAAHRGKIRAECPDGVTLTMAVTLPAGQTAGCEWPSDAVPGSALEITCCGSISRIVQWDYRVRQTCGAAPRRCPAQILCNIQGGRSYVLPSMRCKAAGWCRFLLQLRRGPVILFHQRPYGIARQSHLSEAPKTIPAQRNPGGSDRRRGPRGSHHPHPQHDGQSFRFSHAAQQHNC